MELADLNEAAQLLDALEPGGIFTFQTFDDTPAKRKDMASIRHGALADCADYLKRQNGQGAGIFVTVNKTDGKGREYRNVERVRALFVDLDGAPIEPVRSGPLLPHITVESSPGRWHAYWLVDGCGLDDFKPLQRGLIALFGGDKACIDLPRVMRLPGFWHRKAAPFMSRVLDYNESPRYPLQAVLDAFGWATPKDAEPRRAAQPSAAPPPVSAGDDLSDDLREALRCISADEYQDWIRIGHALKTLGPIGLSLWLEWSMGSAKFDQADALKRWEGFHPHETTHQAVFAEAKRFGWDPRKSPSVLRKRASRRKAPDAAPPSDSTPLPDAAGGGDAPADSVEAAAEAEPAPLDTSATGLIERFELIHGTKQVWDCSISTPMQWSAFLALVGRAAALKWLEHDKRRVRMLPGGGKAPAKEKKRGGRGDYVSSFKLDWMLPRYALIYGTEAVFDRDQRRELTLGALRAFAGLKAVRDWGDHPKREVVNEEQVLFDPRRPTDEPDICNLWAGWPIEAAEGDRHDREEVRRWLEVLYYACNESDAVFAWILKWIAYPLRYPGTKMTTSVIMHGPEGSGKNTIWDAVRRIYGRYGIQITQTQLEQQWSDWISARLFIVGNEVLHRQEQVQQKGRLKTLISDPTVRVERKFLPGRTEQNFANMTFLSNELVPLYIDPEDRRFLVIWTPPPHPDGLPFYAGLGETSMSDRTVQALYHYFLTVDLTGFNAHTKPPMTQAKRDLIDASLESHQRFVRDWLADELPVRCRPCTSRDLYHAYLFWCREYGERFPKAENKFAVRAKKEMAFGSKRYMAGGSERQGICYVPHTYTPPPDKSAALWLGEEVTFFREDLKQWRNPL